MDEFFEWKSRLDTEPVDTGPVDTGPVSPDSSTTPIRQPAAVAA
jgi:hypothetical protein